MFTCMDARKMKSGMLWRTITYNRYTNKYLYGGLCRRLKSKEEEKRLYTAVFSFLLNRSSWLLLISACICDHNGIYWGMCNSTKHCSICIKNCFWLFVLWFAQLWTFCMCLLVFTNEPLNFFQFFKLLPPRIRPRPQGWKTWPRPWPRPHGSWPRPRPRGSRPRPRRIVASLTSLLASLETYFTKHERSNTKNERTDHDWLWLTIEMRSEMKDMETLMTKILYCYYIDSPGARNAADPQMLGR